ncbi:unnamed protein product, partial [Medioppia subpectinata]
MFKAICFLLLLCQISVCCVSASEPQKKNTSDENFETNDEKCSQLSFSDTDIETALNRAEELRNRLKSIENDIQEKRLFIDTTVISAAARHLIPSQNKHFLREIHENQRLFEEVSRHLIQNRSLSREEALSLKHNPRVESHKLIRVKRQTCRSKQAISCPAKSRFRTPDGSCNNVRNTRWGKSFECIARLLDPEYADGVSVPRVARSGRPLPNPRILSVSIHAQEDVSANYTHMLMQFGQFLDHDISLTPVTQLRSGGIQCCPRPTHPDCFEIPILPNDAFYNRMGKRCINFVRSVPCESCTAGARLQLNELSAFIDASNVYGNSLNDTLGLRNKDGLLAVGFDRKGKHILPQSNNIDNDQCSRPNKLCFRAGDNSRVNQHPALTLTGRMRQHNRVASALKQLNPTWDSERVFQESRRIIGAQMQMITYNEFLPIVLGPKVMQFYKIGVNSTGFTKYDPAVNPSILSEFSSAAFRFGHSIVNGRFTMISASTPSQKSSFNLRDNFFTPTRMHQGQMDFILRGLVGRSAQRFDPFCHGDLLTGRCSRPNKLCFRAGDNSRVNQHPALTTLHTLWMRQHNRVASALKQLNPTWDSERVFQESRRIIGAQMQMITYNEFLPIVLGPKVMQFYKIGVNSTGFTKYDPAVNPSILSEFSSAAF